MRLEYRYGQIYYTDLHPGDMIPDGCGGFKTLNERDIDENGYLNYKQEVTNSLNNLKVGRSEYDMFDEYNEEYEDDFYDESVNSELNEFIESIKSKAKKEFIDRLNALEKENKELQDIKENYDDRIQELERKYRDKVWELEKEYKEKEYKLYRRPISEIFPFVSKPYYKATTKSDYVPKCDKCNDDRQFVYVDPLGEKHKFNCTCNKREFSGYEVEEKLINFISEISIRDGKPCMWVNFNVSESSNGDYISGSFFDKSKIVSHNEIDNLVNKYCLAEKISRYEITSYYFESKEDCEEVVSALNSLLYKVERN